MTNKEATAEAQHVIQVALNEAKSIICELERLQSILRHELDDQNDDRCLMDEDGLWILAGLGGNMETICSGLVDLRSRTL